MLVESANKIIELRRCDMLYVAPTELVNFSNLGATNISLLTERATEI